MPKLKTKRAAAKRFRVKPSGKIRRAKANCEHILTKKPRSRKNRLKKGGEVAHVDSGRILRCLPYR